MSQLLQFRARGAITDDYEASSGKCLDDLYRRPQEDVNPFLGSEAGNAPDVRTAVPTGWEDLRARARSTPLVDKARRYNAYPTRRDTIGVLEIDANRIGYGNDVTSSPAERGSARRAALAAFSPYPVPVVAQRLEA
jgi:hypothetical protein